MPQVKILQVYTTKNFLNTLILLQVSEIFNINVIYA